MASCSPMRTRSPSGSSASCAATMKTSPTGCGPPRSPPPAKKCALTRRGEVGSTVRSSSTRQDGPRRSPPRWAEGTRCTSNTCPSSTITPTRTNCCCPCSRACPMCQRASPGSSPPPTEPAGSWTSSGRGAQNRQASRRSSCRGSTSPGDPPPMAGGLASTVVSSPSPPRNTGTPSRRKNMS